MELHGGCEATLVGSGKGEEPGLGPLHLEISNFLNRLSNGCNLDLNPPSSKQKNWICMTPECLKDMN